MKFFRKLGFDSIAWSLRRLYCPVNKKALVLEVGSGGNPYFRANVLCDAYLEETPERNFVSLVYDRPIILAFAENLPFRDDVFDFVIASHVFEHSKNPEKFLKEIQRVGKAGYIEVPDAFMERVCAYPIHRLEISERSGELIIRKKKGPIQDQELRNFFIYKASQVFSDWVSKHPFHFHIRYYWSKNTGGIKYKVINPKYEFDWEVPNSERNTFKEKFISKIKRLILVIIRKIFSQNKRNKKIDLLDLLICNNCKSLSLDRNNDGVFCKECLKNYPFIRDEIVDFTK